MAVRDPKSKIKQLIKKREAIINKIEKYEIAYEEECIKRRKAIQDKQDELKVINQEILSLIDIDEVNAFMRRFTADFLDDKSTPEDSEERNQVGNDGTDEDDADGDQDADESSTFDGDEYTESFRKQYGL